MALELALIAAVAKGGVIGRGSEIPWRLPRDVAHFRRLTTGHPIVMGRLTWESIGVPLPKRTSIVISSRQLQLPEGVIGVSSLRSAIEAARETGAERAFVIGGAAVYREALEVADRLFLTRVLTEVDGDIVAAELEADALSSRWKKVSEEPHGADERHAHAHVFEEWHRRKS